MPVRKKAGALTAEEKRIPSQCGVPISSEIAVTARLERRPSRRSQLTFPYHLFLSPRDRRMIGLTRWFVLICIVGSSLPLCAHAQPNPAAVEEEFFAFFNRVCLLNMPRLDKVRAIARLSQWKPVTGDLATLMAPADPATTGEGWAVAERGQSMFVGISEGKVDGRKMATCAALGTKFNSSNLVKIIESSLGSSALSNEVENLQRYRVWKGSVSGQQVLVQLTTAADDKVAGGTLAVMARAPN